MPVNDKNSGSGTKLGHEDSEVKPSFPRQPGTIVAGGATYERVSPVPGLKIGG